MISQFFLFRVLFFVAILQLSEKVLIAQTVELTTKPENASIFVDSIFVGRSPIHVELKNTQHILSVYSSNIRRWNVLPLTDTLKRDAFVNSKHYALIERNSLSLKQIPLLMDGNQSQPFSTYLVGAGTVFAGSVSAYFKLRADRLHQQYLDEYYATGFQNTSLRNSVRRNDVIASVSLVLAEMGFMYLAYSLLNF